MRLTPIALAAALVASGTLASCQTPCVSPYAGPVRVLFACEDETHLDVTFTRQPDTARILQEGFAPVTLPALITGSGYRYGDEGVELRGTGGEARWSRPGGGETLCREVPSENGVPTQPPPATGAENAAPVNGTRNYCRA